MTSTRYEQPELPLAEASLAEHQRLTGHEPLAYRSQTGATEWVCLENGPDGECFASWPPATKHELRYEKAMLNLLRTGTFQVGSMTVEYVTKESADRLRGAIARGEIPGNS